MRTDERKIDEIRNTSIQRNFIPPAEGSALISMGNTRVICTASIEEHTPPFISGDGGWLSAEYALLPRSTETRNARESRTKIRGRTREIQRFIGRSLRAGLNLSRLPAVTIIVDCDVIQADGGTRTAAVTGAWVALMDALNSLYGKNFPPGLLHTPFLAAVSVGIVNDQLLLDLNYEEDFQASADANMVMTDDLKIVEFQITAEENPFSKDQMLNILDLGQKGISELIQIQKSALKGGRGKVQI